MILQILILLAGLALVVAGAEFLVDGASAIARKAGISEFVIGLTIVGMGTSAPEMVVSFVGAIQGNADIAIGNVVGSNIFNTLLILGVTAFILPMGITRLNMKKDIPLNIFITVLFIALGMNATLFGAGSDKLSRIDGAVLLAFFCLYLYLSFHYDAREETATDEKQKSVLLAITMIAGGLGALIYGGNLFVNSATAIAKMLHVSDKFIAVTILAGGTSMPELATCIVAAAKKKGQLALGNIIGSNIFNILLILGGSALIHPLSLAGMSWVDLGALLLSAVVIWTSAHVGRKNELDRLDGAIFILLYAGYIAYLMIGK